VIHRDGPESRRNGGGRTPAFVYPIRRELLGWPELSDPYFDPMWDVFNESGAIATFHIAAGATKAEFEGHKAELEAHLRGERDNAVALYGIKA
jgi:hypothetical protein